MNGKCPICNLDSVVDDKGSHADIYCRRCGRFWLQGYRSGSGVRTRTFGSVPDFLVHKGVDPRDTVHVGELLAPYLSIYIREITDTGARPVEVDIGTAKKLEEMAETYADTPISAKPDKLLRLVARRTLHPGARATVNAELDYPAVHATSSEEFDYHLQHLASERWTSAPTGSETGVSGLSHIENRDRETTITHEGWSRLGASGSASRTGFVAMSFDPSLDSAYSDGIAPAISDAGYEPLRVDKVHHNEKICDRIVVEMRRSRFVVADVTLQRQGVYFEAGFAMALGLPVIWCCSNNDLKNVHFDTRQYNHIVWEKPADLKQQLLDRVTATIGMAH